RIDDEARQPRAGSARELSIAANAPVDQVVISGRDPPLVAQPSDDVAAAVAANQDVVALSTDQRVALVFATVVVVTFVLAVLALIAAVVTVFALVGSVLAAFVLTTFVVAIVMVVVEDAADQDVVTQAAVENVAASASDQHVVAGAADQPIVSAATVEIVVAVATDERVVAPAAEDRESCGHDRGCIDHIVTVPSVDHDRRQRAVRRLLHHDPVCAVPRIEDEALDRRQLEDEWGQIAA